MGRVRAPGRVIAVDTCVVVRFLTRDDPAQAARAKMQIEAGSVFVPRTVVLEVERILRNIYRFDRDSIASGLTGLLALPDVRMVRD